MGRTGEAPSGGEDLWTGAAIGEFQLGSGGVTGAAKAGRGAGGRTGSALSSSSQASSSPAVTSSSSEGARDVGGRTGWTGAA